MQCCVWSGAWADKTGHPTYGNAVSTIPFADPLDVTNVVSKAVTASTAVAIQKDLRSAYTLLDSVSSRAGTPKSEFLNLA